VSGEWVRISIEYYRATRSLFPIASQLAANPRNVDFWSFDPLQWIEHAVNPSRANIRMDFIARRSRATFNTSRYDKAHPKSQPSSELIGTDAASFPQWEFELRKSNRTLADRGTPKDSICMLSRSRATLRLRSWQKLRQFRASIFQVSDSPAIIKRNRNAKSKQHFIFVIPRTCRRLCPTCIMQACSFHLTRGC